MQFQLIVVSCVSLMVLLAQAQASGMKGLLAKTGKDNVVKQKVEKKATNHDNMEQIARSLGSLGVKSKEGHVGRLMAAEDMIAELDREFAGQPNMKQHSIRKMKQELSAMRGRLDSSDSDMEIRNSSLLQRFNSIHKEEIMRAGGDMSALSRNGRLRASTIILPPTPNDAITSLFGSCNIVERTFKESKYYSFEVDITGGSGTTHQYTYMVPYSWMTRQNLRWSSKGWKDNILDCVKIANDAKAVMFKWNGWCDITMRQYCPDKHQHTCQDDNANELPVYYSNEYTGESETCDVTTAAPPEQTVDGNFFRMADNEVLI